MKIGILQCGSMPQELAADHGSYGRMVERLVIEDRKTQIYDVTRGVLPVRATECDAYVLTGSQAGVYDSDRWIGELLGFARAARGRAKLVGICFGHQALATAFGGTVIKSPKGWGIGLHRYHVRHRAAWMDDVAHIAVPASHQDQVTVAPPGARVTLSSDFTPYAGFDYGDAISFQSHPEFGCEFGTALIEHRRDRFGDATDPAIASYDQPDDCARVKGWIGRFLDGRP
jgi:GMP synthase-like glutamine amidotransferase